MPEPLTLFAAGCEDEDHNWSDPVQVEGPGGVLTARLCLLCGLNHTKLTRIEETA